MNNTEQLRLWTSQSVDFAALSSSLPSSASHWPSWEAKLNSSEENCLLNPLRHRLPHSKRTSKSSILLFVLMLYKAFPHTHRLNVPLAHSLSLLAIALIHLTNQLNIEHWLSLTVFLSLGPLSYQALLVYRLKKEEKRKEEQQETTREEK